MMAMVKKLKADVALMKKGAEKKVERLFGNMPGQQVVAVGNAQNLTFITRGDASSQRDGNYVLLNRIELALIGEANTTVVGNQTVRILIVRDKQQVYNTAPPTAEIFTTGFTVPHAQRHIAGMTRFQTLYDRFHILERKVTAGPTALFPSQKLIRIDLKFKKGQVIQYNGGIGSELHKDGIYLFCYTDTGAAPATETNWNWEALVHFTDS